MRQRREGWRVVGPAALLPGLVTEGAEGQRRRSRAQLPSAQLPSAQLCSGRTAGLAGSAPAGEAVRRKRGEPGTGEADGRRWPQRSLPALQAGLWVRGAAETPGLSRPDLLAGPAGSDGRAGAVAEFPGGWERVNKIYFSNHKVF